MKRLMCALALVCSTAAAQIADPNVGNIAVVPIIVNERATWGDTPGVPGIVNFRVAGYWTGTAVDARCALEKELPDGTWFQIETTGFEPPTFYVAAGSYNFNVRIPKRNSRYRLILRDADGHVVGATAYVMTLVF